MTDPFKDWKARPHFEDVIRYKEKAKMKYPARAYIYRDSLYYDKLIPQNQEQVNAENMNIMYLLQNAQKVANNLGITADELKQMIYEMKRPTMNSIQRQLEEKAQQKKNEAETQQLLTAQAAAQATGQAKRNNRMRQKAEDNLKRTRVEKIKEKWRAQNAKKKLAEAAQKQPLMIPLLQSGEASPTMSDFTPHWQAAPAPTTVASSTASPSSSAPKRRNTLPPFTDSIAQSVRTNIRPAAKESTLRTKDLTKKKLV